MWSEANPHPPEPPPAVLPAGRGVHIWRTAVIMPFISGAFVAMRFYSRIYLNKRKMRIDDYIVLATLVFVIGHAITMAQATKHGMGLHVWQYTDELNSGYYLWIGIQSIFYVLSLMGFKTALILLYLQIFGINRKFRIACYCALVFTIGYLLCNGLTEFLGCHPVAKKWHSDLPGHCIDTTAANIFYGAGHMSSDLIIAILPLTMIWSLKMKARSQKIGLSLVLSSGFFAWAIACVRWSISTYNQLIYDRPWWAGISFLFAILEVNAGLICACIATLGPLFSKFWRNFISITTYGRSKGNTVEKQQFWDSPQGGSDPQKGFSEVTTIGGSGGRSRKMSLPLAFGGAGSRKRSIDPDDAILLTTMPRTTLSPIPPRRSGESTEPPTPSAEGIGYALPIMRPPSPVRTATGNTFASDTTFGATAHGHGHGHVSDEDEEDLQGGLRYPAMARPSVSPV